MKEEVEITCLCCGSSELKENHRCPIGRLNTQVLPAICGGNKHYEPFCFLCGSLQMQSFEDQFAKPLPKLLEAPKKEREFSNRPQVRDDKC